MFNTLYQAKEGNYDMPSGTRTDKTYKYVIDPKTGRRKWKEVGETDRYAKIQESLEDSKLVNIIKRATTDPTILMASNGMWVDVTEMPRNLMEAQNSVLKARQQFADLPLEIRKKFDNDVDLYVSMYGTKEWAEALGYTTPLEVQNSVESKMEATKIESEVKGE